MATAMQHVATEISVSVTAKPECVGMIAGRLTEVRHMLGVEHFEIKTFEIRQITTETKTESEA